MKDLKLSFPYPSTSRHNLSQDIATSLSMGLVIPVRVVEVLPGDSHRIGTSFSLISNPLVKPLLQGVKMRYARFWVPRRIYHLDRRANNSGYDPNTAPVRALELGGIQYPLRQAGFYSNFQQSSLFDYLGYSNVTSNLLNFSNLNAPSSSVYIAGDDTVFTINAEPYLGYIDICRNYFADSATDMIAWTCRFSDAPTSPNVGVCVSPLNELDSYIDGVQNSRDYIKPYDFSSTAYDTQAGQTLFSPFMRVTGSSVLAPTPKGPATSFFDVRFFGLSHVNLCVPLNRPDRLSRFFDLRPLTSQNATVSSSEVTIANLSFLSKLQRFLTRKFFGGSRFTDVMYSIFGQKVPHVDSPVLLDVFDYEIGSELVASTNSTADQNPGVLGGYFSAADRLTTSRGKYRTRYTFNENGYLIDVVYIMPRLYRSTFVDDFIFTQGSAGSRVMQQGNFVPDFNGIGWQQPAFVNAFRPVTLPSGESSTATLSTPFTFASEPSWQQYRTLPDVCRGALNPTLSIVGASNFGPVSASIELNSPIFTFNDRMNGVTVLGRAGVSAIDPNTTQRRILSQFYFSDPNDLNRVFGTDKLVFDNIFAVFRYAHQAKRQVSKRFTLTFA